MFSSRGKIVIPIPEDEMDMLESVALTPACERAQQQFDGNGSRRTMNLSDLKGEKGHCVWCDGKLSGRQQRWCSEACVNAATFHANPQSPNAKMQRLIHKQQFACAGCGVSFEDQIRTRIRRIWERENALGAIIFVQRTRVIRDESHPESKVSYYQIGDNTGHIHQADHIIPIHKGGAGIDPRNLQILCVPCHKAKTIKERMA